MNSRVPAAEPALATIAVRTKNRPRLFERAIDDVLAQTSSAWRLLVINDGGERTPVDAVIEARLARFPTPPEVIEGDHPIGRDALFALALEHTTGEYLAIHDDDDTWSPDFLERTSAWLHDHPDHGAVAVSTQVVLEEITDAGIVQLSRFPLEIPHDTLSLFDLILGNRIPPIGMLLRRRTAEEVGGFDDTLSVLGDWDLTRRLATRAPIGYLGGAPLAFWHQRPNGTGDAANSVHGDRQLHHQTDRLLRDRAIRDYISAHGTGELLYVSRLVDERVAATENALTQRLSASRHAVEVRVQELQQNLDDRAPSMDELVARIDVIVHRHTQYHSAAATLSRFAARLMHPRRRR